MSWAQGLRGGSWGSMSWAQGLRGGSWGSMSWAPFIRWALLGPFICSTRNKSQMAPNEKVPSNEKLGLRAKHRVKVMFLIVGIVFLQKYGRKKINVRAFSTLRIGLSCHMRSTFEERVFQHKIGFRKSWRLWAFLEGGFGSFRKTICEFVRILARNRDGQCC